MKAKEQLYFSVFYSISGNMDLNIWNQSTYDHCFTFFSTFSDQSFRASLSNFILELLLNNQCPKIPYHIFTHVVRWNRFMMHSKCIQNLPRSLPVFPKPAPLGRNVTSPTTHLSDLLLVLNLSIVRTTNSIAMCRTAELSDMWVSDKWDDPITMPIKLLELFSSCDKY